MFDHIHADLARFAAEGGAGGRAQVRGMLSQGFQALLVYRFFRWCHVHHIPTQPLRFIIERLTEIMTGISLPAEAEIGPGLRIHHFGGIIFHPHVKMGAHGTLYHGVTLGDKGGSGEPPTVGRNVLIGAGAKLLGAITIGDDAIIGANAVVIHDVPAQAIVGGVPAKVIGRNVVTVAPPRKINVMQCRSTYTTGGGPDKTVLLAAEKHDRARFNIVLMYLRGAQDDQFMIAKWAQARGLTIHEVLEYKKLDWSNLVEIHRLIKQYQIDIYHARDYKTCFIGYLLHFLHPRLKLIFTAHGWVIDSTRQKFYTWLNLASLKRYHRMIAVSEATKQMMLDSGVPAEKITVILNGVDVDVWHRANVQSTLRAELGLPSASRLVGVVGRLRFEKDIPTTLKVAQQVIQQRPDAYFVIVGDGPDRESAAQTIREMGLADHILLLGFRQDTLNIYAALDVFASTSLTEGTPNTVLEAMALAVPVVHTAVGGVPELIEDGHDGILCQVGDVPGIAAAILRILNDAEHAARLGQNARSTICARFSFQERLRAVEQIYTALCQP